VHKRLVTKANSKSGREKRYGTEKRCEGNKEEQKMNQGHLARSIFTLILKKRRAEKRTPNT
jgi:hypothetical protein